ncbi:hypothetical protein [Teichococcus aestuarii]|nr:hypothetical protein [Pseudoroseomonas aestuarii]
MSGHSPQTPSPSTTPFGAKPTEQEGKTREAMPDIRQDAKDAAASLAEEAKQKKRDITEAATERAESLAEQGKAAGAERAEGLAHAVRRVADDLEDSSPEIARHVRAAAESVEGISSSLRERSVGELVEQVNGFARRQPTAFFGAAVLAGFAITRFARVGLSEGMSGGARTGGAQRSSHSAGMGAEPAMGAGRTGYGTGTGSTGTGTAGAAGPAPGWVSNPAAPGAPSKPVTMPAATLGGAAAHRPGTGQPGSMPRGDEVTS